MSAMVHRSIPPWFARVSPQTFKVGTCTNTHLYSTDNLDCLTCLAGHVLPALRLFLATMTSHGNSYLDTTVFLCSLISYPAASWPPPVLRRPHPEGSALLVSRKLASDCLLKINRFIDAKPVMAEEVAKNAVPGGIHSTIVWQCGFEARQNHLKLLHNHWGDQFRLFKATYGVHSKT